MSSEPKSKPEGSLKKQLISLGIIVFLVVGGWYLSAVVSEAIFQRGRYDSVDRLDQTDPVTVVLSEISLPNFTTPDSWGDFDPSLLDLLAGLPFLSGMFGFDNMDQLNTPVFRVYEVSGSPMTIEDDDLWRLSAYDQYMSNGWQRSDQAEYPLSDTTLTWPADYTIRMPFGKTAHDQIALPTVILDGIGNPEIYNMRVEDGSPMSSYDLKIDSQKGGLVEFMLNYESDGNLTYDLFQKPFPFGETYYDGFEFDSSNAPTLIKNRYLQFPNNDKTAYYNNHPYFQTHIMNVNTLIGSETRTYEIADIIRTYLGSNFQIDLTFPLERPGTSDDIVEWFLERGEGLPMDFAAAFVMMCRWFNIPSRYTMGYNSRYVSTEYDPVRSLNYRQLQMSNMDAWNEIYFPTDGSGGGNFAPFIISPSFSLPTSQDPEDINILINSTYSISTVGLRGYDVLLDFEIEQAAGGGSNDSLQLQLYDHTEELSLGSVTTSNGYASYTVHMNNSFTAGAHFISVQNTMFQQNACAIVLADNINIQMSPPSVFSINRSISNDTDVMAYIYDPVNNNRVKNAVLHPVITLADAAITDSVIPSDIKVDTSGTIDQTVTISEYVAQGNYEIRVDFNGTYEIVNPMTGFPQNINIPLVNDASSNNYPFQVIDDNQKVFDLYIDGGTYTQEDTFYKDRDTDTIGFNVYLEQASTPVVGATVEIRDRTYGGPPIAYITTVAGGTGSTIYTLSSDYSHWVAGVHELYGYWQGVGRLNQSFYLIIDETIDIEITSHVNPPTINRATISPTTFSISGRLWDSTVSQPVKYGYIGVIMTRGMTDYTGSLTGSMTYLNVGSDGQFSATYGVLPTTPLGTYNISIGFQGDYLLEDSRGQHITHSGFIPITDGPDSLTVNDPSNVMIEMWIDYTPTQGSYFGSSAPQYSRGANVRIDIVLWEGIAVKPSTSVSLYDETLGRSLGSSITNSTGGAMFLVNLDSNFVAGLNMLSVSYSTVKNYTQIHLDDAMYVDIVSEPDVTCVRGPGDSLSIAGYVRDSLNNKIVKGASMQLFVRDFGGTDRTDDITTWLLGTPGKFLMSDPITGQFLYSWRMPTTFQGVYRVTVYFTGDQADYSMECQASYYDAGLVDLSGESLTTVYAGSKFVNTHYSPQTLLPGNPVYVDGTLQYDNGTAIVGVTVTIQFYNGAILQYSDTDTTDGSGDFSYSTTVLWGVDEIRVVFAQDDVNYIMGSYVEATYT